MKKPWAIEVRDFTPSGKGRGSPSLNVDPPSSNDQASGDQLIERVRRRRPRVACSCYPPRRVRWTVRRRIRLTGNADSSEVGRAVYRGVPLLYFELYRGAMNREQPGAAALSEVTDMGSKAHWLRSTRRSVQTRSATFRTGGQPVAGAQYVGLLLDSTAAVIHVGGGVTPHERIARGRLQSFCVLDLSPTALAEARRGGAGQAPP